MSKKKYASTLSLFGYSIFHPLNVILLLNGVIFILQLNAAMKMTFLFALTPELFFSGRYWQVFTYGFLHSPNFHIIPFHILMNMYAFYILGIFVEPAIGKTKLVFLYFAAQLGGGIFVIGNALVANYMVADNLSQIMATPTLGASGAVFGLLAMFGLLYPDKEIILLFFPVRAKNAVIVSLIIGFLLEIFVAVPISNMGHLGGAVVGYIFYFLFVQKNENKIVFKITLKKEDFLKVAEINKEPFKDQISQNIKMRDYIKNSSSIKDNIAYLQPYQVPNANICPPATYNTEDEFCLRCEWFGNCMLRKTETEK